MQKIEKLKYPNVVAEEAVISDQYKDASQLFTKYMIDEFLELSKIPRPSGHVEKIRKYLFDFGKKLNLQTYLDKSGCVYIDIPASDNCENIPKIILQSHMDMVAVAAKEYTEYDPLTTPIYPFVDQQNNCIHTKWKTTLGADDGHGIATSLALARLIQEDKLKIKHGPIRILFTYDEETTLEGCQHLSPSVIDAKYLLNLDSIYVGLVVTSAAGGFCGKVYRQYKRVPVDQNSKLLSLNIWGLTGGHSGQDIDKNRCDVLEVLLEYLNTLVENSIKINLNIINSGTLMNSIPAKMSSQVVIPSKDVDLAKNIWDQIIDKYMKSKSDGMLLHNSFEVLDVSNEQVLDNSDSLRLLNVLTHLPTGVIESFDNGHPKTSNNIGYLDLSQDHVVGRFLYRSVDNDKIIEVCSSFNNRCIKDQVDFTIEGIFPTWPRKENNPLNALILESYEKACGFIGDTLDVHSGLETGYLAKKNPDLIIATLGCDVVNEHTRKETLFTKSIPAYIASLLYILENLHQIS